MSGGDQEPGHYYVGIDVGTGSVRAALVDQQGILLAFAEEPIKKWEPQVNHHEQSSEDIWAACCLVTKVRVKPRCPVHVHAVLYVCTWCSQDGRVIRGLELELDDVGFAFQKQMFQVPGRT